MKVNRRVVPRFAPHAAVDGTCIGMGVPLLSILLGPRANRIAWIVLIVLVASVL